MTDSKDTAKKAAEPDAHAKAFAAFMRDFLKESDRAAVILGAAKIDSLLCSMVESFLRPVTSGEDDLLEGDAPLSTFSARIKIAYRLGLIDPEFAKLLHTLRRLRNSFAHEVTSSALDSGGARDRVLALYQPFRNAKVVNSLIERAAKEMGREVNDPGVIFRGILAAFYIRLRKVHDIIEQLEPVTADGIVPYYLGAKDSGEAT